MKGMYIPVAKVEAFVRQRYPFVVSVSGKSPNITGVEEWCVDRCGPLRPHRLDSENDRYIYYDVASRWEVIPNHDFSILEILFLDQSDAELFKLFWDGYDDHA